MPPLLQLSIILNVKNIFAASRPCLKHFTTPLSSKCNENLGHIAASGWDFPETSHMLLTLPQAVHLLCYISLYTTAVQSAIHKVAYIHNS